MSGQPATHTRAARADARTAIRAVMAPERATQVLDIRVGQAQRWSA
jgi:hypothetical protein